MIAASVAGDFEACCLNAGEEMDVLAACCPESWEGKERQLLETR